MPVEPHVVGEDDVVETRPLRRRRIRCSIRRYHARVWGESRRVPRRRHRAHDDDRRAGLGGFQAASSPIRRRPGSRSTRAFSVKVRPVGGDWQQLDVYKATVDRDTRSTRVDGRASTPRAPSRSRSRRRRRDGHGSRSAPVLRHHADGRGRRADGDVHARRGRSNVSFEVERGHPPQPPRVRQRRREDVPQAGPRVIVFGPGIHRIAGDHVLGVPSNTTRLHCGRRRRPGLDRHHERPQRRRARAGASSIPRGSSLGLTPSDDRRARTRPTSASGTSRSCARRTARSRSRTRPGSPSRG